MQEDDPWITQYVRYLVDRYFGPCGLVDDAINELRKLPKNLSRMLGKDEDFWRQYLSDPNKPPTRLNLIEGAVSFVGENALRLSEEHGRDVCYYLNLALDKEEMTNWLAGYLRAMVRIP
ncbi:MAG: hypothetical protein QW796_02760 [Thermoproteota archaeon]